MRRIDAPVRYMMNGSAYANKVNAQGGPRVRLVDDGDYRKLLAVAREAEKFLANEGHIGWLMDAVDKLNAKVKP